MRLLKLLASQVLQNQDDQNRNHHFFSLRSPPPLSLDHSIILLPVNKVRSLGVILHPSSHSPNTASICPHRQSSRPMCWHFHPDFLPEYTSSFPPSDVLECTWKHKFACVTLLLKSLQCLPKHCRIQSRMGSKAQLDRFLHAQAKQKTLSLALHVCYAPSGLSSQEDFFALHDTHPTAW